MVGNGTLTQFISVLDRLYLLQISYTLSEPVRAVNGQVSTDATYLDHQSSPSFLPLMNAILYSMICIQCTETYVKSLQNVVMYWASSASVASCLVW